MDGLRWGRVAAGLRGEENRLLAAVMMAIAACHCHWYCHCNGNNSQPSDHDQNSFSRLVFTDRLDFVRFFRSCRDGAVLE